jgi:hypothetical protein
MLYRYLVRSFAELCPHGIISLGVMAGQLEVRTHIPAAGSYPRPITRSAQLGPPGTPIAGSSASGIDPKKLCVMFSGDNICCIVNWLQFRSDSVILL